MEIAMFLSTAAGLFCLLSYWLVAVFGHLSAAFPHPLKIAQRLSNNFWHFPAAFLNPFSSAQRLSTAFKSISLRRSAKTWQFSSLFSNGKRFC
jgi:hypothetical protein